MTVLDDHFGPERYGTKPVGHVTKPVGKTAFPRAEEAIRPILDAFLSEVRKITQDDYSPPSVYQVKWTAGARDLAQVLKADPWQFMPWAFQKHMQTFPDSRPDSPRSLVYLVERYKPVTLHNWNSVICSECFQSPCVCVSQEDNGPGVEEGEYGTREPDCEPDGSPQQRHIARWIRDSVLNPDVADRADPPDRGDR